MLVLTHREQDTVYITLEDGRKIEITFVAVRGGQVKTAYKADKTINIVRSKVLEREAAKVAP